MGSAAPNDLPAPGPRPRGRSVALAGILGWALPGLGHLYVGRPLKGLLFFAATVPIFGLGLALTDFTCVNPEKYRLEFAAHVWLGAPTALAVHWTQGHVLESLPRWFDVGRLYAAVAGLLNVVALSDVLGEAIARNRLVARWHRRIEAARHAAWVEMLPPEDVGPRPAPTLEELDGGAAPPDASPTPDLPPFPPTPLAMTGPGPVAPTAPGAPEPPAPVAPLPSADPEEAP